MQGLQAVRRTAFAVDGPFEVRDEAGHGEGRGQRAEGRKRELFYRQVLAAVAEGHGRFRGRSRFSRCAVFDAMPSRLKGRADSAVRGVVADPAAADIRI